jgi:hypothetical protein
MQLKTFFEKECEWVQQRFSPYLDAAVSPEERTTIHDHVRDCHACSKELDAYCKTLSLLMEFRDDLPAGIRTFRLPRATFVEIFPTIQKPERPPITMTTLAPYFSALIFFLMLLSGWESAERHFFKKYYNTSNYIEVVGKA